MLAWIQDFLTGRWQRVAIEGKCSYWRLVTSGVSQGSVFGPLPEVVSTMKKIFAGDTKLDVTAETDAQFQAVQIDILSMCQWLSTWQLEFYEEKYKVFMQDIITQVNRTV